MKLGLALNLAAAFFSWAVANLMLAPVLPYIKAELSLTPLALGVVAASFGWPYALMQIPVGVLSDRYEPRRLVVGSMLVLFFSSLAFAASPNAAFLIASRVGIGLGSSFIFVVGLKAIEIYYEKRERGKAMGIFLSALSLAIIGIGAIVPFLLAVWGLSWRVVFALASFSALFTALLALLVFPRGLLSQRKADGPARHELVPELKQVVRNRYFWIQNLISFVVVGSYLGLFYWIPSYFVAGGLGITLGGVAVSLIGVGSLVGSASGGWLTDRIRRRKPLLIGALLLYSATILLIVVVPVGASLLLLIFPAVFLMGVSSGGHIVNTRLVIEIFPKNLAGTALGINNMMKFLGLASYSALVGALLTFGFTYQQSFLVLLASTVLSLVMSFLALETAPSTEEGRRTRQSEPPATLARTRPAEQTRLRRLGT